MLDFWTNQGKYYESLSSRQLIAEYKTIALKVHNEIEKRAEVEAKEVLMEEEMRKRGIDVDSIVDEIMNSQS